MHLQESSVWIPPRPSRATRQIALRSKRSFRGALVSPFNDCPEGRSVVFDSRLELKTLLVILARTDIVDLWDQPPAVSYVDTTGKRCTHVFDFLAIRTGGRKSAIAVKPVELAERLKFRETLTLIARQLPPGFADEVVLVTERTLTREEVYNAEMFHAFRRHRWPEVDAAVAQIIDSLEGLVLIGNIVRATGFGGRAFRSVVLHIADGHLEQIGRGVIDYDTRVKRRAV